MKTKACTNKNCKQPTKPVSEFSKDNRSKDGLQYWCKDCIKENHEQNREKIKKHDKKFPWERILKNIKQRCENPKNDHYKYYGARDIVNYLTIEDCEFIYKRDKARLMKQPSIDRKDNDENYTLDNCVFIEHAVNSGKDKRKTVLQYDPDGNFIREWSSITEASRGLGITHVGKCCNGKAKTAGGFKWKFKNNN